MRTLKKSGAIVALTVALLVMAVLVTQSCRHEPPTQKGTVRLIFGDDTDARTIMPLEPDFLKYDLAFVNTVNTAYNENDTVTAPATTITTALEPGTYTLTVSGYVDDPADPGNNEIIAARASTAADDGITTSKDLTPAGSGFTISPNAVTTVTVRLKPHAFGTGAGTLSWDIDFADITTADTAVLTIRSSAGAQLGGTENLITSANGSRGLPSGVYLVDVNIGTLTLGTTALRDMVHIYQNMESNVDWTFQNKHLYLPPTSGAGGSITYISPEDKPFTLSAISTPGQVGGTDGTEDHPIIIGITGSATVSTSVAITLTNSAIFPGGYNWVYDGDTLATNDILTANTSATTAPFNGTGTHRITLTGIVDAGSTPPEMYSMVVHIQVNP